MTWKNMSRIYGSLFYIMLRFSVQEQERVYTKQERVYTKHVVGKEVNV
jgi:hypothetical protein